MGRTIKFLGSGPLAGETFYGMVAAVRKRAAEVELDVPAPFNLPLLFDSETGMLVVNEADQTDLVRVDPHDLPKFQDDHCRLRNA